MSPADVFLLMRIVNKCWEKNIQQHIQNFSHAHTQHEFFKEILTKKVEILHKQQEEGLKISDTIDVALYILKVNPLHWSTFARISCFDRDSFEPKLADIVHDLLYVQHFCNNSDYSQRPKLTEAEFVLVLIQESIKAATNNIKYCKTLRKPIVRSKSVHPCFFTFTTNGSEGMASRANHSGMRLSSPSRSINLLLETHEK